MEGGGSWVECRARDGASGPVQKKMAVMMMSSHLVWLVRGQGLAGCLQCLVSCPSSHVETEAAKDTVTELRFGLPAYGSLDLGAVLLPARCCLLWGGGAGETGAALPRDTQKRQGPRRGCVRSGPVCCACHCSSTRVLTAARPLLCQVSITFGDPRLRTWP